MRALPYLPPLVLLLALAACDLARSDDPAPSANLAVGHEEEIANNLSFPVIWGDGAQYTLPLRGTWGVTRLDGAYFETWGKRPGERWYVQGDSLNEWQAESASARGNRPFIVDAVDWGDNLEARDWPHGQQVRVEVALMSRVRPMWAATMRSQDPTVHGPDEVWGTNGVAYRTDTAMVYSGAAQLLVQRLTKPREDSTLTMTWNGHEWTGDVGAPLFRRGVWETHTGPGGFKAEVNAKGRVIYGFNWQTATVSDGPGDYRITFVLQQGAPVKLNTGFNGRTFIVPSDDHGEAGGPGGGAAARLMWQENLSYIDVRLTGN